MSDLDKLIRGAPPLVRLDRPAEGVLRILIDRPEKRNAMDHRVREALTAVIGEALATPACRALVLGGVDGVFSAGGDVHSMGDLSEHDARARMRHIQVLCRLLASARLPVVSAMEGVAAGAAVGMALLGDEIVVGDRTRILFPFLKLGLTPDWGLLLTLPRRVGVAGARQLLTRGDAVSGDEAVACGLADERVDDDAVMATAVARAERLAALPPRAFARMKARLNEPAPTLAEALHREEDDQASCLLSAEFSEGLSAFLNKRAPNFRDSRFDVGASADERESYGRD